MADNSEYATLVASTPANLTVNAGNGGVWVHNLDASAVVYARFDGSAAAVATAGSFVVPPGSRHFPSPQGVVTVSLISTGTPLVGVDGQVPIAAVQP